MKTRIDAADYRRLTGDQRRTVDLYLAHELGLPLPTRHVTAVDATAEGTVRVERVLTPWHWTVCHACGRVLDPLRVRQTLRPALPPPWLAWPEEADPCE